MRPTIDIHQHLWPEALLRALSERREPPLLVRRGPGWLLRTRGEPEAPVDLADHDPDRRAALVRADGVDRALVAPSVPLGIEALPARDAGPLLAAFHEGVLALPAVFGAWAAVGLADPDPAELARLLDRGFAGACVAAGELGGPEGFERLVVGGAPRRLRHRAGDAFDFDASHVHRMRQDCDVPAVSIHAYSPPLWRMGAYTVGRDGTLRRQSISYAEELRPVEAAA